MIVDDEFLPTQATAEYLYKKHFTRKHIWKVVEKFRISFAGQEFQNIQEKFKSVMKKEFATNAPVKPNNSKEIIEKREKDFKNKSTDGAQRAQEAKQQEGILTQEEVLDFITKRKLIE